MTKHCLERIRKRVNLSNSAACKFVSRAVLYGNTAEEFSSAERSYLQNLSCNGSYALVYSDFCFIFSEDEVCITVYHVPKWFGKRSKYIGKTRIKNPKKYCNYYCREAEYTINYT